MDPHTGRVLAMVGGFSYAQSEFNRATQAMRQPGSSFKPFVYAAALDNGYTPASVILDAPIDDRARATPIWRPKNYDGKLGRPVDAAHRHRAVAQPDDRAPGQGHGHAAGRRICQALRHLRQAAAGTLPMSLGSGETTVLRMVSAYSVFANGGKQIKPTLIDRIQDRYGKTIFKHDERVCEGCDADDWTDQAEPELVDNREQVLDPMTAYQITSMMEGVVQRGTAATHARARPPDRRQDRHDQRREGRLVRRLHAGPRRRRLYRLRQAAAAGQGRDRRRARGADLQRLHADGARRTRRRRLPRAGRHDADRRSTARPACAPSRATPARSWRPSSPAPARPTPTRSSAWTTAMARHAASRAISPQADAGRSTSGGGGLLLTRLQQRHAAGGSPVHSALQRGRPSLWSAPISDQPI